MKALSLNITFSLDNLIDALEAERGLIVFIIGWWGVILSAVTASVIIVSSLHAIILFAEPEWFDFSVIVRTILLQLVLYSIVSTKINRDK